MKNNFLYGIMVLVIAIIATINTKSSLSDIEQLSNISIANIEALANSHEADAVSCSVSLNCYNAFGNLIKTVECSSSTGDCTSGREGLFQEEYIKCEGHKYTC